MVNIIKDLLNIKNCIKLFKNPKALKRLILVRFFSYPSKRLAKINNNLVRNLLIKFWIYLSKKNNSLNYFFFSEIDTDYNEQFKFEKFNNDIFSSLKNNGIAVIENILSEKEHKKVCEKFDLLADENGSWLEGPKNITKSKDVDIVWAKENINYFSELEQISNEITSKVYGKKVKPSIEFYMHKSINVPEETILGENHLHMDRFIPNLKIYYSPYDIKYSDAPFKWVLRSHKINNKYRNYWLNLENFNRFENLEDKDSYLNNFQKKDIFKAELKKNSLIAVFTNGLHSRSPFEKENSNRKVVFMHYGAFDKVSLFKYSNYNKINKINV